MDRTANRRRLRRMMPLLRRSRSGGTTLREVEALAAENEALRRHSALHAELIQLVLAGRGVAAIAERLSALLGNPVAVADHMFHLLASFPEEAHGDRHRREAIARRGTPREVLDHPLVGAPFRLAAERREPVLFPPFPEHGMEQRRLMAAISAGDDILGYVTVLEACEPFQPFHAAALHQATFILALELMKQRVALETELRLLTDFLSDLLSGNLAARESLVSRAGFLGVDLFRPWTLLLAAADDPAALGRAAGIADLASARHRLFELVRRAARRHAPGSIAVVQSERIVLLCPAGGVARPVEDARLRATALREEVARIWPGATISVAVGGLCAAPGDFAARYAEAGRALDVVRTLGRADQTVALDDLGVYGLLFRREECGELRRFADRLLAPLVEHDRRRGSDLLGTLDAYLQTGGFRSTARRLAIHLNTLRGRLDRIEQLTGLDLHDAAARLNLQIAIEVYRFARSGGAGADPR